MIYLVIAAVSFIAGLVQGVTGFGACIVIMMALPFYFTMPVSAGLAGAIPIILCLAMVIRYRKEFNWKKAVVPYALYFIVCSLSINFSVGVDQELVKKVFGVFLIILSIYYLFFNKFDGSKKISIPVCIVFIIISAICDGMFGIGGPLMVLYFLSITTSSHEYLGTIQMFFLFNTVYNTCFRFVKGILVMEHMGYIAIGTVAIFLGLMIANRIVDKMNADILRKLTYVMIGVSGIINIL